MHHLDLYERWSRGRQQEGNPVKAGAYREPFRYRGYTPLYIAYTISRLGDWIYLVGFSLWLLDLTGSPALMAWVAALQTIPRVLLGAITGSIADRVHRAKLMALCDMLQGALVLPLLLVHTRSDLPIVYVVAFCLALLSAQASVAKGPLIASILPRELVVNGNAVVSATESVIIIVGPAIGAWAVSTVGIHITFLINAASFLASGLLVQLVARQAPGTSVMAEQSQHSFLSSIAGFFQAVGTRGLLRQLLAVVGLLALGQGVVQALHTPFLIQMLHLTKQQYAAVLALQGLGGVVGSYLVIPLCERYPPRVVLGSGLVLGSLTTVLMVTYPNFWVAATMAIAEGVVFTGVFVSVPTLIQQSVAQSKMGRAFAALDATENGFMLFSMTVSGMLVSFTPMRHLFLGVSAAFVFAGWLAFRTLNESSPATARRDTLATTSLGDE